MAGFNLPPGCSVSDIPGNRPEDDDQAQTHSPLPWAVHAADEILDGNIELVAKLWAFPSDGRDRLEARNANARLIVTAVNSHAQLVEACREAEAAIEWEDPSRETGTDKETRLAEALEQLRAAIAKAEQAD